MQAFIKTDDIGFLSEWSPEAEEIFGFKEGEVTGWYLGIFIHSIEKMKDEKRNLLGLENILEEVVEKGNKIEFSTINIRGDLKAFYNTIEIEKDGDGTKAMITKGEDTQEIIDYNKIIDKLDNRPLAVTSNKGRILGINGKFALMAKLNRMRLLNRPLGMAEDAEKIRLGDVFDTLDGVLMAWPEQK
jgi:PAS domain-containing protein